MSYSNISDILLELNKDASNQKSALALSNTSEIEIKNLLKQIDSMIHHKKLRWERQRQELDNKIQLKEQEAQMHRAAIEQKNAEIGQLKKLLENTDKTTQDIMKKYEKEINILHQQLTKLKAEYIKMQKKYKKSPKKGDDEPPKEPGALNNISPSSNSTASDIFVVQSSCSDAINRDPLSQFKLKSSALHTANQNAAANLKEFTGVSSNVNFTQPTTSSRANKIQNNFENELINLNAQLEEHKLKEKELFEDKDRLQKLVDFYKNSNQELVKNLENITRNPHYAEKLHDAQSDKINLDHYKQEIRKKEEHIKQLESLERGNNIELQYFKDEVKKYKKQEATFKNEMDKMKNDYEEAMKRLENIEKENKKIKSRAQLNEDNKSKNDEMFKRKLEQERERHIKEITNLKNEINSFSAQLNDKNSQVKALIEKSNCLEKLLKEKEDQLSKANHELIMTVAHVEALRLENNFLRQSLVEKKSDEKDIVEMQKKYHHVLDLTEKENKRLKSEVISLTECIESLKNNKNNTQYNFEFDNRRIKILREEYEKQIENIKVQHDLSIKRLSNEIDKLHSEKYALLSEFENKQQQQQHHTQHHQHHQQHNNYLNTDKYIQSQRSNRSNVSMTNGDFISSHSLSNGTLSTSNHGSTSHHSSNHAASNLNEIEHARKNTRIDSFTNFRFEEPNLFQELRSSTAKININASNDFMLENFEKTPNKSARLSTSSHLKNDEQKRKKDLENILDTHIECLRRSSANEHIVN